MSNNISRLILTFFVVFFAGYSISAELKENTYSAWYGDINGDGLDDIYLQAKETFVLIASDIIIPILIQDFDHMEMLGGADGGFGGLQLSQEIDPAAYGLLELDVLTGDFTGDSFNELVVQSPIANVASFLLSPIDSRLLVTQTLGGFANSVGISADVGQLSVEDVNADGIDDLVLYDNENIVRVVLGGETGFAIPDTGAQDEDPIEDATAEAIMKDFSKALIDGNSQKAINYIEPTQRARYSRAFSDLGADLSSIAQGFSTPTKISQTGNTAEFVVQQTVNGQIYAHICSFNKNQQGRWFLNGL